MTAGTASWKPAVGGGAQGLACLVGQRQGVAEEVASWCNARLGGVYARGARQ